MTKLWAGRTAGTTANMVDEINSSIGVDRKLYRHDIQGSIAHAKMLAHQGVIPEDEAETIIEALEQLLDEIESGNHIQERISVVRA